MSEWLEVARSVQAGGWGTRLRSAAIVLTVVAAAWGALTVIYSGVRRFCAYMEARIASGEEAKRVRIRRPERRASMAAHGRGMRARRPRRRGVRSGRNSCPGPSLEEI